jgi:hypothetical protein
MSLGISKPWFRPSGFIKPITSNSEILKKEIQITKVNFFYKKKHHIDVDWSTGTPVVDRD